MDHKILLNLLNQLSDIIKADLKDDNAARTVLGVLVDYMDSHFADEEKLMQSMDYPDLEAHKQAHMALRDDVSGLTLRIDEMGDKRAYKDLYRLLNNWWRVHILGMDQDYHGFIQNHYKQNPEARTA